MKAISTLLFVCWTALACLIGFVLAELTPSQPQQLTKEQLEQIIEAAQYLEHK